MKIYSMLLIAVSLSLALTSTNVIADDNEDGSWAKAQESADKALQESAKAAQDLWEATKDTSGELWQDGQETSFELWQSTKEGSKNIWLESQDLWKENNQKLQEFLQDEEAQDKDKTEEIRI